MTPTLRMLTSIALACLATTALLFAGKVLGAVRLSRFTVATSAHTQAVAQLPLTVIEQSADGTRTCAAQGFEFGAGGVVTLSGVVCAADVIFKGNFE